MFQVENLCPDNRGVGVQGEVVGAASAQRQSLLYRRPGRDWTSQGVSSACNNKTATVAQLSTP